MSDRVRRSGFSEFTGLKREELDETELDGTPQSLQEETQNLEKHRKECSELRVNQFNNICMKSVVRALG